MPVLGPPSGKIHFGMLAVVFLEPLIAGLKTVCRDEMGREAVRGGIQKIVIPNTKGCSYGDSRATLADGVLTLDHEAVTNAGAVDERANGLVAMLESSL